jgi:hypothetical protein
MASRYAGVLLLPTGNYHCRPDHKSKDALTPNNQVALAKRVAQKL